jgi:hypothetical protein
MAKVLLVLAVLGLGYWYWTGSRPQPAEAVEAARLAENAAIIQQCVNQEQRMQSAGGLGGLGDVGASGADAERLCAEKNGLVKRDGQWYKR